MNNELIEVPSIHTESIDSESIHTESIDSKSIDSFLQTMTSSRLTSYRTLYLILIAFCLLIILPFITHYYLNQFSLNESHMNLINGNSIHSPLNSQNQHEENHFNVDAEEDLFNDINTDEGTELKKRIKDLLSIRSSVRNELRLLESKRRQLMQEMSEFNNKLDQIKLQVSKKSTELDRLHASLEQAKFAQKELMMRSNAFLAPPLRLLPSQAQQLDAKNVEENSISGSCRMQNCFDYSRCSLTSPFLIYFYHPDDSDDVFDIDNNNNEKTPSKFVIGRSHQMRSSILDALNSNIHVTFDPTIACIYVVVLFEHHDNRLTKSFLDDFLHSLPYWAGDGRNHVIINLLKDTNLHTIGVDMKKAILVQTNFKSNQFRHNYDIISSSVMQYDDNQKSQSPLFCPARRKYLVTFLGQIDTNNKIFSQIKEALLKLTQQANNNEFLFDFVCDEKTKSLCANQTLILRESTFALILPPYDMELISHHEVSSSLINILSSGSVPVLIGGDYIRLPYDEVIDWRRAVIHMPISRVTELHLLLRSYSDADILELRRQGKLLYERHLISINAMISTTFALLRQSRLHMPSPPAQEEQSINIFNATFPMKMFDPTSNIIAIDPLSGDDENLGPIEPPFPSLVYQRNFSLVMTNGYYLWNDVRMDPFTSYPSLPFDPIMPSDAKFIGSSYGFRPIGAGAGGSGKEFSEALGGNVPKEQFTIVMLTYEREAVLIDSLQRLKGLPHLNKILVVWNSPSRFSSSDLLWPDVGAPIHVIKSKRNSLNNRFLPYDDIETDAILSMDDDAHLRHDEIVFGFRVWREARDRIVGFPGRFHAWDNKYKSWNYNSNYSCELSMILTGAAFFHKYYSYLYTYSMPQEIRDKVDEYMNCEDIAMNFLVSHISRQPPIKVTSRWTFRCPGCPVSLSEDDSHFHERHKCINFFVSLYGYMPLLNTQFRADSVLFKTRIPHDKQKCFKFI